MRALELNEKGAPSSIVGCPKEQLHSRLESLYKTKTDSKNGLANFQDYERQNDEFDAFVESVGSAAKNSIRAFVDTLDNKTKTRYWNDWSQH